MNCAEINISSVSIDIAGQSKFSNMLKQPLMEIVYLPYSGSGLD